MKTYNNTLKCFYTPYTPHLFPTHDKALITYHPFPPGIPTSHQSFLSIRNTVQSSPYTPSKKLPPSPFPSTIQHCISPSTASPQAPVIPSSTHHSSAHLYPLPNMCIPVPYPTEHHPHILPITHPRTSLSPLYNPPNTFPVHQIGWAAHPGSCRPHRAWRPHHGTLYGHPVGDKSTSRPPQTHSPLHLLLPSLC